MLLSTVAPNSRRCFFVGRLPVGRVFSNDFSYIGCLWCELDLDVPLRFETTRHAVLWAFRISARRPRSWFNYCAY